MRQKHIAIHRLHSQVLEFRELVERKGEVVFDECWVDLCKLEFKGCELAAEWIGWLVKEHVEILVQSTCLAHPWHLAPARIYVFSGLLDIFHTACRREPELECEMLVVGHMQALKEVLDDLHRCVFDGESECVDGREDDVPQDVVGIEKGADA